MNIEKVIEEGINKIERDNHMIYSIGERESMKLLVKRMIHLEKKYEHNPKKKDNNYRLNN